MGGSWGVSSRGRSGLRKCFLQVRISPLPLKSVSELDTRKLRSQECWDGGTSLRRGWEEGGKSSGCLKPREGGILGAARSEGAQQGGLAYQGLRLSGSFGEAVEGFQNCVLEQG